MKGEFDRDALIKMAQDWPGLAGMDLAKSVTRAQQEGWQQGLWTMASEAYDDNASGEINIIALDYGCKHNILRCLTDVGFNVQVVPATTSAEDILAMAPEDIPVKRPG